MAAGHRFHRFLEVSVDIGVVQNRLGVHTNVVVDDELQPCQAHSVVGQLTEVKSQLGVAHVHGDLDINLGHDATLNFCDFGV